ncbi:MAG: MarR family winged helix-turn-helix transcriptional regulator [Lachnospiraceae bacterium]
MDTYETLNIALEKLFRNVMDIEQRSITTQEYKDITNNDMHVMQAIGIGEPKNMSTIAKTLSVTVGTLTIAMNSLVKKGYVIRERGERDRRVVYISLSEKGRDAYSQYEDFHRRMIADVLEELEPEETKALMKALVKLEQWFHKIQQK